MVGFPRVNWQEQLEQGFKPEQAQPKAELVVANVGDKMMGGAYGSGAFCTHGGRVNWQERLGYGFQHFPVVHFSTKNNAPPQQFSMGRRETYAEEELLMQHINNNLRLQKMTEAD